MLGARVPVYPLLREALFAFHRIVNSPFDATTRPDKWRTATGGFGSYFGPSTSGVDVVSNWTFILDLSFSAILAGATTEY